MTTDSQRRLAAIVLVDVVGYSRLMGADETGTLDAMRTHRQTLWDPAIERHGGRVVNRAGDSALIEFASAVAAMECSIAIQAAMAERNAGVPENKRVDLRVGVNVGEVVVDGEEIYGDGVNIAARLQTLADPGGIALSGNVYENIVNRLDLTLVDDGEHTVKNIARPVHVWRWRPGETAGIAAAPAGDGAPLALPDKPSIAVLPFDNMSGDPDQEYFSDGISEDIITALSGLHWLFVIARNSTFTFKGAPVDVKDVSRKLGVRYVLEGSVRKAGKRVRITAQLIDGINGNHVWAERYDRELDDIFALQDEITESIVDRIDSEVRLSELERVRRKPPATLDVWELYQRGLWHAYKVTKEDTEAARGLFQQAIARDAAFAAAHAGFALTHVLDVFLGFVDDPSESIRQGLAAGEHAVALDDKDNYGHYVLGRMLALAGQGERAIAELEKAVALNPSSALGYYGLGLSLNWYGRAADGISALDRAMRLSPQDPLLWAMQTARAACCNSVGRYDEAQEWARKALNARVDQLWPNLVSAQALAGQDRLDEARAAIKEARRLRPDLSLSVVRRLSPHFHPEYLERHINDLRKTGLTE